ncbi:MAG: hypothetical protein GF330_06235 [Candidatus Eisenbacteria bacterium]|nr:hypothetical protein [Candidatus Eisenbacteria bacterium]
MSDDRRIASATSRIVPARPRRRPLSPRGRRLLPAPLPARGIALGPARLAALAVSLGPALFAALVLALGPALAPGGSAGAPALAPLPLLDGVAQAQPIALARAADPGPTPAEAADFAISPDYPQTMAYLRAVADASPHIELGTFGYTTEGRPLPVVFVRDHAGADAGWDDGSGKPTILVNAGIHSGEICGKDALLMLLRDIARGHEPDIVAHLRLILVPIFNLDGHERRSLYNRFTQDGPGNGFGTRRNALRLDLNRDFLKLETPECQALVRLFSQFQPEIFVDLHTNDGFDHQYDLLYGIGVDPTLPEGRDALVDEMLVPSIQRQFSADGFRGHPIGYPVDAFDITAGLANYDITSYLATGYFESRQAISVLSEAHPYVPYARRVGSTLTLLRGILRWAAVHRIELSETVARARREVLRWSREPGTRAVALGVTADRERSEAIRWLGKPCARITSTITGRDFPRFRDEAIELTIPYHRELKAVGTQTLPRGYLILRPWGHVVENLRRHTIKVETLTEAFAADVEAFRYSAHEFSARSYQGHHLLSDWEGAYTREYREFPAGTYWVSLDQPAGLSAFHLLEPEAGGALVQWNYFDTIFERGIILEDWALEENALRLLEDPQIRAAYEAALADSAFAADPDARLEFFFRQTPYVEEGHNLYPVFRVLGEAPAKLGPS